MRFIELVEKRCSVRNYSDKPLSDDIIQSIMENIRLAPSAKNLQQWYFYWVLEENLKKELSAAAKGQKFVQECAAVLVGVGQQPEYLMTCGYPAYIIDLSIAMEHAALSAAEMGIGTCWIGAYYRDEVKKILHLPHNEEPVQMMTFGYPVNDSIPEKKRKDVRDIYKIIQ